MFRVGDYHGAGFAGFEINVVVAEFGARMRNTNMHKEGIRVFRRSDVEP